MPMGAVMDTRFLNPVTESASHALKVMLQMSVTFESPEGIETGRPQDVSGIVGLSGDVDGSLMIRFPLPVAHALMARLSGDSYAPNQENLADGMSELINMIAGAAKSRLPGMNVTMSGPLIVYGADHTIHLPEGIISASVPCITDAGNFRIDVAIRSYRSDAYFRTTTPAARSA